MIELKNVSKKYGELEVIKKCNLTFSKNNIYIIKGKSGSGKTTLLNLISGLDKKYDGQCLVNDKELKQMTKKEHALLNQNVSYIMQKNLYYKKLTIRDNLKIISKDDKKIEKFAKMFHILEVLDKKPSDISGGELQRVSLIKALLLDSSIIILDEPTSNLDHKNAMDFATYLNKIDVSDKIIIIATHKNIFDEMADVIIEMDYGNINITKNKKKTSKPIEFKKKEKNHNIGKMILKNIYKENIFIKLFVIFMLVVTFVSLSYYVNYREEYVQNSIKNYPYHVLDVDNEAEKNINKVYKIEKKYYDYRYEEKGNQYYTLLDEEDSTLTINNVIFMGDFPKEANEVLVNAQYAKNMEGISSSNYEDVLGKKIKIKGEDYIITGLVGEDNIDVNQFYESSFLYNSIINNAGMPDAAVFIPYNSIAKFGKNIEDKVIITLDKKDLSKVYEDSDFNKGLFYMSKSYDIYKSKINHIVTDTESPTKAAIILSVMLLVISFFFLINEVELELFFRQREMGYLKLIHFSKDDIHIVFILEYMLNFFINIVIAICIYYGVVNYIFKTTELRLTLSPLYIIGLIVAFLVYSYLIILLAMHKYIKKETIELLKS